MVNYPYMGMTMTVAELIAALQKLRQDAPVLSEGCDCYGTVHSLECDDDCCFLRRGPEE